MLLISRPDASKITYSANVVTDASGLTVGEQRYYPFGETRWTTGTIYTDKLFTGQRDTGLGIYDFNARMYDPKLGRFLSADTIVQSYANPQSLNRFAYVLNNPLRYTDPTGHKACGDGEDTDCNGHKQDPNKNPHPYKSPKKHKNSGEGYGANFHLTSACSGLEDPCEDGGAEAPDSGGSSGDPYPPSIAGIPTSDITIENAPNLGVEGDRPDNRIIVTGVDEAENVNVAQDFVSQLKGDHEVIDTRPLPNGKGEVYYLDNGAQITFRPAASDDSDLMPKINVNFQGKYTGLIFYPK